MWHFWKRVHIAAFVLGGRLVGKRVCSWVVVVRMHLIKVGFLFMNSWARVYEPTNRSKAAGFRSSRELSSFKGVRHFWQYILSVLERELRREIA
jgi:hypothetical protein